MTDANGLGPTPAWIKLQPTGTPPAITGSSSVIYDEASNRLIVYGGCVEHCSPASSDVFTLSGANGLAGTPKWTKSTVTNLQERAYHSSVYDPLNNLLIAFAGNTAFFGTDQNDARVLSNANGVTTPSTWTTLRISGGVPPIRNDHRAMYDGANNRMMIFGGSNFVTTCCPYVIRNYNDAWVLGNANGKAGTVTWTQLNPAGGALPVVRGAHSAVYDPLFNRMVVFSGSQWNQARQNWSPLGDLWQLNNANGLGAASWTKLDQTGAVPQGYRIKVLSITDTPA